MVIILGKPPVPHLRHRRFAQCGVWRASLSVECEEWRVEFRNSGILYNSILGGGRLGVEFDYVFVVKYVAAAYHYATGLALAPDAGEPKHPDHIAVDQRCQFDDG